tara:strand:- start:77 stop:622 length:546 start_codon:yes stop_codon:yes gene_type:complete
MENIIDFYNKEVSSLSYLRESSGQGAVRNAIGDIYQELAKKLILSVDPNLTCKHNDFLTKYSPSGKYKVDNLQVDLHVYRDEKLLFILESKTYLDVCYLKRAVEDFNEIREIVGNVPAIIWSGQNALADNAFGYYNECYDFETFYCNVMKKRNSSRPIYKTCDPLDVNVLGEFKEYVASII